jgi:hypothetical protein
VSILFFCNFGEDHVIELMRVQIRKEGAKGTGGVEEQEMDLVVKGDS